MIHVYSGENVATEVVSRAGKRGELYPPKDMREAIGIRPGSRIIFRLAGTRLEVEAVPSLEELIKMKPIATITLDEFDRFRSELSKAMTRR